MSLFSDTVDSVYTLTNRPDLVAETALAVRQATLSAHRSDYYLRDMVEVPLPLTSASIFQLDIPTFFPRWRAFSYIRPYDNVAQSAASWLVEFLKPEAIFDEYLVEKVNVAYVAGTNLNIKLSAAFDGFIIGYYQNPVLTPDASYESWITREHEAVVVWAAVAIVFGMIGYEDAAQRMRRLLYEPGPDGGPSEFNRFRGAALEEHGR